MNTSFQAPLSAEAPTSRQWLPLGAAQRAVWLDLRLHADPLAYQLTGRARIGGDLDLAAVRQAVQLLLARHDALRLRIDPEQPRQWLATVSELPLTVHEWIAGPDTAVPSHEALEAWVAQRFAQVLPLGDAPPLHIDLVRVGSHRWELLWRCSHLVADAVSVWLMIRHWAETYNTVLGEVAGELPAASSFVGALAAEQAALSAAQTEADMAHWRQRYAELPGLVFERDGAAKGSAEPVCWTVDGAAYARWRTACAAAQVTEQRALLALLALAVGTRQDRRDFSIGMALHRRDRHTRDVIGMLAGILPVRCQWQPDDSVRQAVRRMAEALEQDYRHQRTAVDEIGRAVGLAARGQGRLFDVSLSYTPADERASGLMLARPRWKPSAWCPWHWCRSRCWWWTARRRSAWSSNLAMTRPT